MSSVKTKSNNKGQASSSSTGARRRLRLWMGCMVLFFGWAGYTFIAQSGEIEAKSQELADRQASLTKSQQGLNQLQYELNRLQDPEYIGQIAMKKYGLYKPGEIPVRVSESETGND